MKIGKALLSCLLTVCLLITPFSGVLVFADSNTGPQIQFGIDPYAYVTPDMAVTITVEPTAADITSCKTRIDGTLLSEEAYVSFVPTEASLSNGTHTLVTEATDATGNTAIKTISFKVVDSLDAAYELSLDSVTAADETADVTLYSAEALTYTPGYGSTSDGSVDPNASVNAFDSMSRFMLDMPALSQPITDGVPSSSTTGIPYQTFDIDLAGKTDGEIVVSYTGETKAGERMAVKVWSPSENDWDTIGTFIGAGTVTKAVSVADYADNGVIHVVAMLDYVTNGSDTIIWITDPQHYTKFEDLNKYYYQVYEYAAAEYLAGNAGYAMNTGDLVDDRPETAISTSQWEVSSNAISIIESVGMPNGVVTGNHDVGDYKYPDYVNQSNTSSNYSKFCQTFGNDRFNTNPWFGSSINDNTSHYDLVTVGNVDFIVLYLGYGMEATDETIAWANEALKTYSHRVGIVATHEYIENRTAAYFPNSRAQLIFDSIVDPNPNVKMVLCGHDDGSQLLQKTASDGRTVYEILCDYQFVEAEDRDFYDGNEHYIGSVPGCCGDGYLRKMVISGDCMTNITYSPITDRYNPYGERESFTIDADFGIPDRKMTTYSFSAVAVGEETATGTGSVSFTLDSGDSARYIAAITSGEATTYTSPVWMPVGDEPTVEPMVSNDLAAFEALIADAQSIEKGNYTDESYEALQQAIADALAVDTTDDNAIAAAYNAICNARAMLKTIKEHIDPDTLDSLYTYDLSLSKWRNSGIILAEQTESGGLSMKIDPSSTSEWAGATYAGSSFTLHPVNGKIYLKLDADSDSAWCIYLTVNQGGAEINLRLNHAIENFFHSLQADGFAGSFHDVYDVTSAFSAAGIDPNCTMTVKSTILYIVPGPTTYDHIEFLTDKSETSPLGDFDLDGDISVGDTLVLYDAVAGKSVLTEEQAAIADIDLDGQITIRDVQLLYQMASGMIPSFNVDRTTLVSAIAEAEALDRSLYTVGSLKRLDLVLPDAKAALTNSSLVQSDINLAVLQLRQVLDDLKLSSDLTPEPENSLLPADEGLWIPQSMSAMNIYRNDDGYTVLQNTNGLWPSADYTLETPYVTPVADKQMTLDITVGSSTNIHIYVDEVHDWISLPKYISTNLDSGSGDLMKGTYKVGIPFADISKLADLETITISKLRVYAVGDAASSAVTIRQWTVDDYEKPIEIHTETTDMMPQSVEEISVSMGTGEFTLEDGVLTLDAQDFEEGIADDYSLALYPTPVYDMTVLNGVHLVIDSEIEFKIAFHVKDYYSSDNSWPNTSNPLFSKILPVENDRIQPGHYDVVLDLGSLCSGFADKSAVYFDSMILRTTGEGRLTMSVCEVVEYDNFDWDESLTYGEAATPDNPYYAHAAKEAPNVAEKVDLLKPFGFSKHQVISAWTPSSVTNKGLAIDLTKTPYLYFSVAQADTSSFTFALYNDNTGNKVPWLVFRDAAVGEAKMNTGAANWDKYQDHEQYVMGSETVCIDIREYLNDPTTTVWRVNTMTLYNWVKETAVVSYLFFGSEPIEGDVEDPDDPDEPDPVLNLPATPDNPIYKQAASYCPIVETRVDVMALLGLGDNYQVLHTSPWRATTESHLLDSTLTVDLSVTPYLYYSVEASDGFGFGFGGVSPFYRNGKQYPDTPGMVFEDTTGSADNCVTGSETGCIDLREYFGENGEYSFTTLYLVTRNFTSTFNYLFFGSAPVEEQTEDPVEEPDPTPAE